MRGFKQGRRGVILITVLWTVLILSLVVWGVSRRSALEVSILSTYQGKLRSYAAARAGINYIQDLINKSPATVDSLYSPGINIPKGKTPKEIFSHIDVGARAFAIVQWKKSGYSGVDPSAWHYGLQDEQGKININALNGSNYQILSALLELRGLGRSQADQLALDIIGFKATGSAPNAGGESFSLKDEEAPRLKPKNKPYEHLGELLEVRGMTQEIYDLVASDLTVYGEEQNGLWVNVNTAANTVIQALANAAQRSDPTVDISRILLPAYALRDGGDGFSFTEDDGQGSLADVVPYWPLALRADRSSFFRVRVEGVDDISGVRTVLEAVVQRSPGFASSQIVGWQRD